MDREYCKKCEDCEYQHPDKVCSKSNCFNEKCHDRHPNPCWWGPRCKFYNKNICLFSHEVTNSVDEKRVGDLEKIVATLQKEYKVQNDTFGDVLKKMEKKFETLEDKIEMQRKALQDKEKFIKTLEKKINTFDHSFGAKIDKLEKISEEMKLQFKCEKCNFVTNSEQGLKTHISKKHRDQIEINGKDFPQQCRLCEKTLKDLRELKKHMRTHSYKNIQFKCNLCEFVGGDENEMEVHLAKVHGDKFECSICDYEAKDLETLETHLITCQFYICIICDKKMLKFTDIKTHFLDKQNISENSRGVFHTKPNKRQ